MTADKDLEKYQLEDVGAPKSADKRFQRINSAFGHWYKIDGDRADGVTGVLGGSVPKPALVGWAAGSVAELVFDEPETVDSLKKMGREAFVKAMKEVPSNDRDTAGRRGTEVHKRAELIQQGEEIEVPDEIAGHVDAYIDWNDAFEPEDVMTEVSVFNLKHRFGGTLDLWAHVPTLKIVTNEETGAPYCTCSHRCLSLIDIKTNRSGPFGEVGLQLAGYAVCEVYIDAAGNVRELPAFDHYFVLWLRSDGYDFIHFDVQPVDKRQFLYNLQVARWNDYKRGRSGQIRKATLTPPKKDRSNG